MCNCILLVSYYGGFHSHRGTPISPNPHPGARDYPGVREE